MAGSSRVGRVVAGVVAGMVGVGASGCSGPAALPPVGDTPAVRVDWVLGGGVQLNAVALGDAGAGAAVGEFGTLLVTHDEGLSWTLHDSITREALKAVAFGNGSTALAAGSNGALLRTEDGQSWTRVTSGSSATLRAVAFGSPMLAVVVGESGTILKSDDGGKSWRSMPSGTTATLRAVRCPTASEIVAVGDDGTVLHSADGGATWERRESGTNAALRSLLFTSATTGVAVGGDDLRWRSERAVVRTTDGGRTWQPATVPAGSRLYALASVGAGKLVALGQASAALQSTDDGQTWLTTGQPIPGIGRGGTTPDSDISNWFAGAGATSSVVVAVTYGGRIYRSTDAVQSWKAVPQAYVAENVAAVARVDESTFVAVAGSAIFRSADDAPLARVRGPAPDSGGRGRNGGAPNLMSLEFPAPDVGVMTGAAGTVLRTVDRGQTWTSIAAPTKRNLRGVAFANDKVGIAVAGPAGTGAGMIRTDDGGLTWVEQECVPGTNICESATPLVAVALRPSQLGLAVGGPNPGPAVIVRTTDGGRHWTRLDVGGRAARGALQAVAWIDDRHAVAVGDGGLALSTSDGGDTWAIRDVGVKLGLRGVAFADASRGLIVGDGGIVFVTTDGGVTWQREAPFTSRDFLAVQFQNPRMAIISGATGVLLRHTWTGEAASRGGSHD